MRSSLTPAVLAGFLIALCAGIGQAKESFLSVAVQDATIDLSGVTPGARVALFGADRQRLPDEGTLIQVSVIELLSDDDGDGAVTYERGVIHSEASVWIGVDLESGRVGSATSWGEPIARFEAPLGLARPIETGPAVVAAAGHEAIELLLVRPGVGAWTALGVDGGLSEETGVANGRVTFYEPAWTTLSGDESGPADRKATDLLFALDSKAFAADAQRVGDLVWLP